MVALSGLSFWFIFLINSGIHHNYNDNYDDTCFLNHGKCVFGKTIENSDPELNSSFSAIENDEKLGKEIGKCYLNPLCFDLEDPQNTTK